MQKFKDYLIIFLVVVLVLVGLFGYQSSIKLTDHSTKDSLAVFVFQKKQLDLQLRKLTGEKELLLTAVDSLLSTRSKVKIVWRDRIEKVNSFTPTQVDSSLTTRYPRPVVVSPDEDSINCQPLWRVRAVVKDLVRFDSTKEENKSLYSEILLKNEIISGDNRIISHYVAKDSLTTKEAELLAVVNSEDKKALRKENKKLRRRTIGVIVISAVVWTLTVLALK